MVQAMYFGRLRYWLWSMPMSKSVRTKVQTDADRLWWSRDPILDGAARTIKRFVARRTAIGPKAKGGVNVMDWSNLTWMRYKRAGCAVLVVLSK